MIDNGNATSPTRSRDPYASTVPFHIDDMGATIGPAAIPQMLPNPRLGRIDRIEFAKVRDDVTIDLVTVCPIIHAINPYSMRDNRIPVR